MKERMLPWWFRKRADDASEPIKTDYTALVSVHGKLLTLLKEQMVPEIIPSREEIGLCHPQDHGDIVLGIFLYDIRENSEVRFGGMQAYDEKYLKYPPLYLDLYYMLTAYSTADLRYREEENHRILAKVMQVLYDNPHLHGELPLHIEFQNFSLEEKAAVWNHYSSGYRLSLFYKVTPVMLDSLVRQETTRVQEIRLGTRIKADKGKGGAG